MKKLLLLLLIPALMLSAACAAPDGGDQINLNDPLAGEGILTATEMMNFLEYGSGNVVTLHASINMDNDILRIAKDRGAITINGNGYSISGNADCVLRLEDGCSLTLNKITIIAGRNGIGTLGDATLGGVDVAINSVAHAIVSAGDIIIENNSAFELNSNVGSGLKANGLNLHAGAEIIANGTLGAIDVATDDLIMGENSRIEAITKDNFNALKCAGTLVMMDGSEVKAVNEGEYHGLEIDAIEVNGVVRLEATGGDKGVGVFLFEHRENIMLLGFCTPAPRFEVGKGSITFTEDRAEVEAFILAQEADDADTDGENPDLMP